MPYRFAIIGCGHISGRHAAAIQTLGTLTAVCDIDPLKASTLAGQFGINAYTKIDELLSSENPDVVTICTPNGLHRSHTLETLQAGCHVLCEKPLAINSQDALLMLAQAKTSQRNLFVVKQNRFNPPVVAVKQLLDEGKLGRIHNFQINCFWNRPASYYDTAWKGTASLDGGILFTQFSHFIDILYWFLGGIEQVTGWRGNFCHENIIEFEDAGVANLVMKNGSIGTLNYTINAKHTNMEGSLTLFGEKGTVKIGGQYLNRIEYFSVEDQQEPVVSHDTEPNVSAHQRVYAEMIRSLNQAEHQSIDAAEAIKSIEMIEQIYRSSPLITGNHRQS